MLENRLFLQKNFVSLNIDLRLKAGSSGQEPLNTH